MVDKKEWPKFINIHYYVTSSGEKVIEYNAFMNNAAMLIERLYELKIRQEDVCFFIVDGVCISKEQIKKTFDLVDQYRKEFEAIEARKKVEQEAENTNKRGRSKSQ